MSISSSGSSVFLPRKALEKGDGFALNREGVEGLIDCSSAMSEYSTDLGKEEHKLGVDVRSVAQNRVAVDAGVFEIDTSLTI